MEPELSAAARRHIRQMLVAIPTLGDRLEKQYRKELRALGCDAARTKALLAVTPAAAARHRTLAGYFRRVEAQGRTMAWLNTPAADAIAALACFDKLLAAAMEGRFAPAREQLQLATVMVLNRAFYDVREAEARCFFGLYRAEMEAPDLDGLLRRFVRLLAHSFHARTGRLIVPVVQRGTSREGLHYSKGTDMQWACRWSCPVGQFAVLELDFAQPRRWLPREGVLLQAAAERLHEAFSRTQIQGEMRRLHAEASRAEEEERRRIARELHDEAGQSLLLLRLELEMMEREIPMPLRKRLAGARQVAEHTIEELRRIVSALSPAVLERLGLPAALRHLAGRFQRMHPCVLRMHVGLREQRLPPEQDRVIYRVAQEVLQNISKHSAATRVNFSLRSTDRVIRLRVTDNGGGFCAEQTAKPMTFGLGGMRERAALLGGTLKVQSAQGEGTAVTLELPNSVPVTSNGKDAHTHH